MDNLTGVLSKALAASTESCHFGRYFHRRSKVAKQEVEIEAQHRRKTLVVAVGSQYENVNGGIDRILSASNEVSSPSFVVEHEHNGVKEVNSTMTSQEIIV